MRQPQAKKSSLLRNDSSVDDAGAEQQARRHADLRPDAVEAAPAFGRMFDRHQHGAAPFAADADALEDAQRQQQQRRPDAGRCIGRQ